VGRKREAKPRADGQDQPHGALGDVTIQALTPASQPSSITTTGDVSIFGNNVLINSTINHKVGGAGVRFGDDFQIFAQHSVNIFKVVGARSNVFVIADGTIIVSGNMVTTARNIPAGSFPMAAASSS
jgi:hypothetical protein